MVCCGIPASPQYVVDLRHFFDDTDIFQLAGLITYMSQIGCFVPAEAAILGTVDRLFTESTPWTGAAPARPQPFPFAYALMFSYWLSVAQVPEPESMCPRHDSNV